MFKNTWINRIHSKEAKDAFYLFLLQCVDKILPLLVLPYLMVTLGAEKYGYVGFSFALIQYLSMFVDFGFGLSATKRIAVAKTQGRDALNRIFCATFYAKCILLLVGTTIVLVALLVIVPISQYLVTVLYSYPLVLGTTLTLSWFYQGIGKIRIVALITSVCRILVLPLIFIFVKTEMDYNIAALVQALVYLLAGFIAIWVIQQMRLVSFVAVSFHDIRVELKESCPLFLSSVATSMYTQLFTLILGIISTPIVVGRYAAAERIVRSLCFAIYSPISTSFYPKVATIGVTNKFAAEKLVKKIAVFSFLIMLCLSVVLFVFALPLSELLGKDYGNLSVLIKIMSIAPVFIALGAILGQMGLIALGNQHTKMLFLRVYVTGAFFSLLLVVILAPILVEIGASIAMVLTEIFVFTFMYYYYRKSRRCLH